MQKTLSSLVLFSDHVVKTPSGCLLQILSVYFVDTVRLCIEDTVRSCIDTVRLCADTVRLCTDSVRLCIENTVRPCVKDTARHCVDAVGLCVDIVRPCVESKALTQCGADTPVLTQSDHMLTLSDFVLTLLDHRLKSLSVDISGLANKLQVSVRYGHTTSDAVAYCTLPPHRQYSIMFCDSHIAAALNCLSGPVVRHPP